MHGFALIVAINITNLKQCPLGRRNPQLNDDQPRKGLRTFNALSRKSEPRAVTAPGISRGPKGVRLL
jgi:hypothetical protein